MLSIVLIFCAAAWCAVGVVLIFRVARLADRVSELEFPERDWDEIFDAAGESEG